MYSCAIFIKQHNNSCEMINVCLSVCLVLWKSNAMLNVIYSVSNSFNFFKLYFHLSMISSARKLKAVA